MELGLLSHLAAGIEIRVRHELEPYQQRLIAALGASYIVDPAAPLCAGPCKRKECAVANPGTIEWERERADLDVLITRCALEGCKWSFEGPAGEGRDAAAVHRRLNHGGQDGRVLLQQLDRGEPVRAPVPEPEPKEASVNGKGRRNKWDRASAIAAVKDYAEEHGFPPPASATAADSSIPGQYAATNLFGGWAAMIEAAGFERPKRGGRRPGRAKPSEREPRLGRDARVALTGEPAAAPSAASRAEIVPGPPAPPPTPVVGADPEKVDVFELLGAVVTEERIAFHEREAERHQERAEVLRQIRQALEALAD